MKHPLTLALEEAQGLLERNGVEITPGHLEANLKVPLKGWNPTQEALEKHVQKYCQQRHIITGEVTPTGERIRQPHGKCREAELEADLAVKVRSRNYDENRIAAQKAEIAFLRLKKTELGYEPFAELFKDDIDRIYAMHGCTPGW